jgi:two-component system, NarL family, sensor histidine kinase EvgS
MRLPAMPFVLCLVLAWAGAAAQSPMAAAPPASAAIAPSPQSGRPLVAVTDAGAWPLAFGTPGAPAQGINADYWRLLVKGTALENVEVRAMPWGLVFDAFKRGEVDFIVGAARTREREAYAAFTPVYYSTSNVLVSRVDGGHYVGLQSLRGQRLAILAGHFLVPSLQRDHADVRIVEAASPLAALEAVAQGRAEAALVAMEVAVRDIAATHRGQLVISGIPPRALGQFGIMVQPSQEAHKALLAQRIGEVSELDTARIRERWLTDEQAPGLRPQDLLRRWAPWLVLGAALLLSSLLWALFLTREVRRRRAAELQLREQHRAVAETASARQRFIAYLAHEVRNLVAGVRGGLGLLPTQPDERSRRVVQALQGSADGLQALLDASLEAAQIDAGQLKLQPELLPVAPLVREVVVEFAALAEAKSVALHFDDSAQPLTACADDLRLRQILRNLVSNALKFTAAGGSVRLRVAEQPLHVAIDVQDSGRGLSAEQIERLFTEYAQAETADRARGAGLGLSISRELARRLRGDIQVQSEPGRGSRFTLTLPREMSSA